MFASTRRTITPGRHLCWKCRKRQRPSGWAVCALPSVRKIINLRKMLESEAADFDNEVLGSRGCCCALGLWIVSCLGGSVYYSEATTCRWWHKKPQKVSTHISKTVRTNKMPLFLLKKKQKQPNTFFFFHFPLHSFLPGLHQQGCCIIVSGCCGPLAILYCCWQLPGCMTPIFSATLTEGSCDPPSCILPPWQHVSHLGYQLSTSSVTAETIIKWQKNVFGCAEAR